MIQIDLILNEYYWLKEIDGMDNVPSFFIGIMDLILYLMMLMNRDVSSLRLIACFVGCL